TGMPVLMLARRLMPRLGEVLVAAPSTPAARDKESLPRHGKIRQRFTGIVVTHERADGHLQDQVRAGVPGSVRAFAVAPAVRLEFPVVAVAQQRVVVRIGLDVDAAAVAAVAAGGSSARNIFLAAECHAAVAAVAGLHVDFCFIDKHGSPSSRCPTSAPSQHDTLCKGTRKEKAARRAGPLEMRQGSRKTISLVRRSGFR